MLLLSAEDTLIDWDTPAHLLPAHLRNAQIQYRERAIYDTVESPIPEDTRTTLIQNFLYDFRQTRHRDLQSSDFPHYRSTDLARIPPGSIMKWSICPSSSNSHCDSHS